MHLLLIEAAHARSQKRVHRVPHCHYNSNERLILDYKIWTARSLVLWVITDYVNMLLQVVVYHGSKRSASKAELESADVVLTTYSIIEGEYRRHTQPNKATCAYCNNKFYPDRLKVHLRYLPVLRVCKANGLLRCWKVQ